MNWDAVGALAELAGAVGVIATLVYLAIQIRQNTSQIEKSDKAERGQSYQNLLVGLQEHFSPIGIDEKLASIFMRGLENFESLDELEKFRFNWVLGGHLVTNENAFYQKQEGMLSDDRWEHLFKALIWFFESPGVRQWWANYPKSTLRPDFCALIEERVKVYESRAGRAFNP